MDNYTLDTAARFGEIPFVDFTRELVTGTFDCLVEAHLEQMETYSSFLSSLTQDISTYINNTVDNVSFSDISDFLLNYQLPKVTEAEFSKAIDAMQDPAISNQSPPMGTNPETDKWWQGLINSVGTAATGLVDKVKDQNLADNLNAVAGYNAAVINTLPKYKDIQQSVAALIASNKYALLQNMAKMGLLRLVVTEGEIETRITFSTWNNSSSGSETGDSQKVASKTKAVKSGGLAGIFQKKNKQKTRTVTVNTAKSYQRDSSGSRVDIFGRVLIRFKTDYAPLNG